MKELLRVQNLEAQFLTRNRSVRIINDVSLTVHDDEILGIVGESGSGKTTLISTILRLIPQPPLQISGGSIKFNGKYFLDLKEEEVKSIIAKKIGYIPQESGSFLPLNVVLSKQLVDPLVNNLGLKREDARDRMIQMLQSVGLPDVSIHMDDTPQQLSVGMRQRVMFANALINSPELLIADQALSALDPIDQAQIIESLKKIHESTNMSIIWITNDLGTLAGLAKRILVMYAGAIIEEAEASALYSNPQHPFTLGMLGSLPRFNDDRHTRLNSIPGNAPVIFDKPASCSFISRCRYAIDRCKTENPQLVEVGSNHFVACWVDPLTGRAR
jgi:oligopeptide transport system ATP-binding protein